MDDQHPDREADLKRAAFELQVRMAQVDILTGKLRSVKEIAALLSCGVKRVQSCRAYYDYVTGV